MCMTFIASKSWQRRIHETVVRHTKKAHTQTAHLVFAEAQSQR